MTVWALTILEVESAMARLERQEALTTGEKKAAREDLANLSARWTEVADLPLVRQDALRILRSHAIGSGDAAQLGAAIVARADRMAEAVFVTLDRQLANAATREGFSVVS